MAEKVKLTISPAVAAYVRPGTALEVRLAACATAGNMAAPDRLMLLFCLTKDAESTVRDTALSCLKDLPEAVIKGYMESSIPHPLVIESLRLLCRNYPAEPVTADAAVIEEWNAPDDLSDNAGQNEEPEEEAGTVNENDEEFLSKYKTAQQMGIGEKIKMALSGDKEWRAILVKDANKLVSGSVIKNPRITEGEVLTLVKSGIQNDEIMRLICANKEWIKSYKIRKALIENNRTPVQNAMRYLGTMGEKDLSFLAKSKNISSVISTMAKRLLLNKKK
ncbi:MAG: hypothetical protein PHP95_07375 [Desulfuromonadaceae bacterium]|nr:hypothetical protein [Desulfuromonadaceae bacterium]MDD2848261.1 hypothetical protein [Desulfuromonadaceae bacterium]MDD4130572.1 hypothetical protein [Desulfuromonadaceae bacterium]